MEINKKAIQELADRIEAENILFNMKTKAEKRVIVAEDCLIRIYARQILPYCGRFINDSSSFSRIPQSVQSQLNTPEVGIQCESCAKGSLFLSYVGRANKFENNDLESGNDIDDKQHKKLLEIFGVRELAYIEFAFEGQQYINFEFPYKLIDEEKNPINFTDEEIAKAIEFYVDKGGQYRGHKNFDNFEAIFDENNEDYPEETEERLIAICENIIANGGEFIL
jgi:hypothetical protein